MKRFATKRCKPLFLFAFKVLKKHKSYVKIYKQIYILRKRNKILKKKEGKQMSLAEIIAGLFDILDKVQNFLFSFGDIAQKFFDMLP